ncbi:MAG TPA: TetR family transcriptional regulator [Acidimicrobiales bacterium]|nr:TetR family transcriptional regulator [Acidimicrobiales bacterium]
MSAVGRRPGHADTRGEIIEAAKRVFAANGYDGTSLRAVAREAGVDPALVHHYFDGKSSLFVAAMALPFDPRQVKARAEGAEYSGARTIESFLTMWDRAEGSGSSFASCMAAMAASTNVADAIREFVNERVWSILSRNEGESDAVARRRTAMVSSQLLGLAFARYILRVPPMSTASPRQIGRWVGPTLDRYVKEPLSS